MKIITKGLYKFLIRKRIEQVGRVQSFINSLPDRRAIEKYQIARFNEIWKTAQCNIPFYREWKNKYALPTEIVSLEDLEKWPILTKSDLRDAVKFVRKDVAKPSGRILTGGSTGVPVRLPAWPDQMAGVSQAIGRLRYGVSYLDRVFLLWGHEHLYGTGLKKIVNKYKRRLKDCLADWKRVSAYDLSSDAMHQAYIELEAFMPSVVIAYSPAIVSFCRQNRDCMGRIKSVRTVVCSAGPLSSEEKESVSQFFCGANICMEYGSVECGIMAYTQPVNGEYVVFWNTHLIQAQKDENKEEKAIVTRLTNCYVPLIRYDVGDYLDLGDDSNAVAKQSVLRIHEVKGRPTELLKFTNGIEFFAWAVGDCVKQVPEIYSHQVAVDEQGNRLEIRVTAERLLTEYEKRLPIDRLARIIEHFDRLNAKVVQVEKLYMTVGGKTPRVVRL